MLLYILITVNMLSKKYNGDTNKKDNVTQKISKMKDALADI